MNEHYAACQNVRFKKRKVGGCWWNCINGKPPEATVVFGI
jgi:hypothetical protein